MSFARSTQTSCFICGNEGDRVTKIWSSLRDNHPSKGLFINIIRSELLKPNASKDQKLAFSLPWRVTSRACVELPQVGHEDIRTNKLFSRTNCGIFDSQMIWRTTQKVSCELIRVNAKRSISNTIPDPLETCQCEVC